jgi:HK97 family phage major capsid protein
MANPIDASGVIPHEYSRQIIQGVQQQSAALALGTRMPMGSGIAEIPVAGAFPVASFVSVGGRKPFTDFQLSAQTMKAEEIAAVISIPQAYLDDAYVDLWGYARPLLAQAIAVALDNAVVWGVGAPASYPVGGIVAAAYSQTVATPATPPNDAVAVINLAMGAVEMQGLPVTGSAADTADKAVLRGVRDVNQSLLLGPGQVESPAIQELYGAPIIFSLTAPIAQDFITGDWRALLMGVRDDITYDTSLDGIIADGTGKVLVSAFQDDQVLMRVHARFGCVIAKPVTPRAPAGAKPFAIANLVSTNPSLMENLPQPEPAPEAEAGAAPEPAPSGGAAGPRKGRSEG